MVILSTKFAVLASLSILATMTLVSVPANAVAVLPRRTDGQATTSPNDKTSPSLEDLLPSEELKTLGNLYKRWDPMGPLLQVAGFCLGANCPDGSAHSSNVVTFRYVDRYYRHGGHVVTTRDDQHVRLRREASPEPHHHHNYDSYRHSHHSDVEVNDGHSHIKINDKRERRRHHYSDRSGQHYRRGEQDGNSSDSLPAYHSFEKGDGTPGIIDIMSSVDGSPTGEKIASLTLSHALDSANSTGSFILNASGTNETQIYLVVLDDVLRAPSNSSLPSNATTSSNSTLEPNAPVPTSSAPKKVALKIPVFDTKSASTRSYCATFDPQPSNASPMTVESCAEGAIQGYHKSQIFSFDPSTSSIQPMWYTHDDDGAVDASDDDDGDDDDDDDDDDGDDGAEVDQPASGNSTASGADSNADIGAAVARIKNLNKELISGAPARRNLAAMDHSFEENSPTNTKNVTLVFRALIPTLSNGNTTSASSASNPPSSNSSSLSESVSGSTTTSSATEVFGESAASEPASTASVTPTITFSSATAPTSSDFQPDAISASQSASSSSPASTSFASTYSSRVSSGISTSLNSSITSPDSAATPTASDHGLDVEVFDPSATSTASNAAATSTGSIFGLDPDSSAAPSATFSSTGSSTATPSVSGSDSTAPATDSASSNQPSMTPASTEPYEWMFRETTAKSGDSS